MAQWKWIWLISMRTQVQSLASLSGLMIWCCQELWCRSQMWQLDLVLLWLCCRPAAVALIWPLTWEPPYVLGVALKRPKKKKKNLITKMTNDKWTTSYFVRFVLGELHTIIHIISPRHLSPVQHSHNCLLVNRLLFFITSHLQREQLELPVLASNKVLTEGCVQNSHPYQPLTLPLPSFSKNKKMVTRTF